MLHITAPLQLDSIKIYVTIYHIIKLIVLHITAPLQLDAIKIYVTYISHY